MILCKIELKTNMWLAGDFLSSDHGYTLFWMLFRSEYLSGLKTIRSARHNYPLFGEWEPGKMSRQRWALRPTASSIVHTCSPAPFENKVLPSLIHGNTSHPAKPYFPSCWVFKYRFTFSHSLFFFSLNLSEQRLFSGSEDSSSTEHHRSRSGLIVQVVMNKEPEFFGESLIIEVGTNIKLTTPLKTKRIIEQEIVTHKMNKCLKPKWQSLSKGNRQQAEELWAGGAKW